MGKELRVTSWKKGNWGRVGMRKVGLDMRGQKEYDTRMLYFRGRVRMHKGDRVWEISSVCHMEGYFRGV